MESIMYALIDNEFMKKSVFLGNINDFERLFVTNDDKKILFVFNDLIGEVYIPDQETMKIKLKNNNIDIYNRLYCNGDSGKEESCEACKKTEFGFLIKYCPMCGRKLNGE